MTFTRNFNVARNLGNKQTWIIQTVLFNQGDLLWRSYSVAEPSLSRSIGALARSGTLTLVRWLADRKWAILLGVCEDKHGSRPWLLEKCWKTSEQDMFTTCPTSARSQHPMWSHCVLHPANTDGGTSRMSEGWLVTKVRFRQKLQIHFRAVRIL